VPILVHGTIPGDLTTPGDRRQVVQRLAGALRARILDPAMNGSEGLEALQGAVSLAILGRSELGDVVFRLGTISADAEARIAQMVADRSEFKDGGFRFLVQRRSLYRLSFEQVLAEAVECASVQMTFLSAALFRRGRGYWCFPDGASVFGGLLSSWRQWAGESLPAELAREFRKLRVTAYDLKSEEVVYRRRRRVGCVGSIAYGLPEGLSPEVRRAVCILARAAPFCGVGVGSAEGLGAVQVRCCGRE
jgi:hypothetical protein